jgi:hypothetical protein
MLVDPLDAANTDQTETKTIVRRMMATLPMLPVI